MCHLTQVLGTNLVSSVRTVGTLRYRASSSALVTCRCLLCFVGFFFFVSIRAVPNGEKWNLSIVLTFISLLATVNSSCLWNEFVWLRTESVAPTRAGL